MAQLIVPPSGRIYVQIPDGGSYENVCPEAGTDGGGVSFLELEGSAKRTRDGALREGGSSGEHCASAADW